MMPVSRAVVTALCLTAAFPGFGQGVDEDDSIISASAQRALEEMETEATEARDTCFALTERYREEIGKAYPRPPVFPPAPCVTGSGLRVVMTCAPSGAWKKRIEGRESVVKIDEDSGDFAEYACRTARAEP